MEEHVINELQSPEISGEHDKLLLHCKRLLRTSREKMSGFYDMWDAADDAYRGTTYQGELEKKSESDEANERKEPTKGKIPLTYAQVETFVSVGSALLFQEEQLFSLAPTGPEDGPQVEIGQALLQRDVDYSMGPVMVGQMLKDIARFSIAPAKILWDEQTEKQTVVGPPSTQTIGNATVEVAGAARVVEQIIRQGNRLINISPYRFFPDVRLPMRRFQEGEFCAVEEESTRSALVADPNLVGAKHLKKWTKDEFESRGKTRFTLDGGLHGSEAGDEMSIDIRTEIQLELIPKDWKFGGKPLGEESHSVKFVIVYGNDARILSIERLVYPHKGFTYTLGMWNADMHVLMGESLVDMTQHLQALHNWFINSHVTSVRKNIDNRMVVDPAGIELTDLKERKPVIRMKGMAAGQDVRKFLQQLNVTDVTQGHVNDAGILGGLMQEITGINEQLLGQVSQGRRSATEMRNVSMSAMGRVKRTLTDFYWLGLKPAAEQMLANHRMWLDAPTYVKVVGRAADRQAFEQFKQISKADLAEHYDFRVFDPMSPQEKHLHAQALMELLQLGATNPLVFQTMQLDPQAILKEILTLRGIKNLSRFILTPDREKQMQQQQQIAEQSQNGQGNSETGGNSGQSAGGAAGGQTQQLVELVRNAAEGAASGAAAV